MASRMLAEESDSVGFTKMKRTPRLEYSRSNAAKVGAYRRVTGQLVLVNAITTAGLDRRWLRRNFFPEIGFKSKSGANRPTPAAGAGRTIGASCDG